MTRIATLPETGTWGIDPAHTEIGFVARHLMAAKVRGGFRAFEGTIVVGDTPETSSVSVRIDAGSIDTGVADRDGHLRSPDFFDVENHPVITFRSTEVRPVGDGVYEVAGELTIRDITKPVVLEMAYGGIIKDPWGNEKAIFSAETTFDREDWGLTWNAPLEAGGWLVGNEIKVEIEVQAVKA